MPERRLTSDERAGAIGILESGVNEIEITSRLNVAQ